MFRRRDGLLDVKYHDKRDVHMLSSIHEVTMMVTHRLDRRTNEPILTPAPIVDYIKKMGRGRSILPDTVLRCFTEVCKVLEEIILPHFQCGYRECKRSACKVRKQCKETGIHRLQTEASSVFD